jgi:hypothetical protein
MENLCCGSGCAAEQKILIFKNINLENIYGKF